MLWWSSSTALAPEHKQQRDVVPYLVECSHMKVVLFCGGLGLRLRDYSETVPKPMVPIGYRPILWHVMKYFAHFGHKNFILCLGYRADLIKEFFLKYDECLSNDFVLSEGGKNLELSKKDIEDWNITFVDTGMHSNIGQRLLSVRPYIAEGETFLANYTDGLTDLYLPDYIDFAERQNTIATFLSVKPNVSYHIAKTDANGFVTEIRDIERSEIRINAGFFVLKDDIFRYMQEGEELVVEPFRRLIQQRQLAAYEYAGFFAAMDTFKDKLRLDTLYEGGQPPWEVWGANKRNENAKLGAYASDSKERLLNCAGPRPLINADGVPVLT
jgi:glucose-1-phosphate cytidylyltransferase